MRTPGGRADELGIVGGTGHAVVIGGSVAGLLAALVLAPHAERVTVLERDRYPGRPEPRGGVPQGRHTHILLKGGEDALEDLLPGFRDAVLAAGAQRVRTPAEWLQWSGGRWWARRGAPQAAQLTLTRPLLEHTVRALVLRTPRLEVRQGVEVTGLTGADGAVTGVRVRDRGAPGPTSDLPADLVVDASGRASRVPSWVESVGGTAPAEERISTALGYASRRYRTPADSPVTDARLIYLVASADHPRSGVILPVEGGETMVTLGGLGDDAPPTDPDGFVAWAGRLQHPVVAEWLAHAEPLGPVHGFRTTDNVRRRYDVACPAGLLVTGDALCVFNPIYGQGITAAAFAARALRDALRTEPAARAADVQRALLAAVDLPWRIAGGADKAMPTATGSHARRSPLEKVSGRYLRRVQAVATTDDVVARVYRSVLMMTAPMSALVAPAFARRVLSVRPGPTGLEPPRFLGR